MSSDPTIGACKICGRVWPIDEDGNLVSHTRFTAQILAKDNPQGRCVGSGKPPWDYRGQ